MNTASNFYRDIMSKASFWLPVVILAFIAFGLSIFQNTISWDDFRRDLYVGSGQMHLAGRWGTVVWCKLLGLIEFSPYVNKCIAFIFLLLSSFLSSLVLYCVSGIKKIAPYTVFACCLVTYPLFVEIWEYTIADFVTTGNMLLVSGSIYVLLCTETKRIWKYLISSMLLVLPASSYESGLAFYLTFTALLLFVQNANEQTFSFFKIIKKEMVVILPLVVAIIIRFVIGSIILVIFDLHYTPGGAAGIDWLSKGVGYCLKNIFLANGFFYFVNGLVYPPITVFSICLIVFIVSSIILSVKKKSTSYITLCLLVLISIFSISILQGYFMLYRVGCSILALFVSGVMFIFCSKAINTKSYKVVVALLLLGCLHQATYTNSILSANSLRSENEVAILRHIGCELESKYPSRPVIFVSSYDVGDWIKKRCYTSNDNWNGRLFNSIFSKFNRNDPHFKNGQYKFIISNLMNFSGDYQCLKETFSYLGFNINIVEFPTKTTDDDYKLFKTAKEIAIANHYLKYSIKEMDNYVIVVMGFEDYYIDHLDSYLLRLNE